MIIKLTEAGKNEIVYVNFDYVRTIRRSTGFTELIMSDDKYHKLAVLEKPEEIYEMLYPTKTCKGDCGCHCEDTEPKASVGEAPKITESVAPAKKSTTKKTTAKTAEEN